MFEPPLSQRVCYLLSLVKDLKAQVEKFLRPGFIFIIGNYRVWRLQMLDSQQVTASLQAVDAKGQPVPNPTFDNPPAWTVDQPTVMAITPSADGLSCLCVAGIPGTATLTVAASVGGAPFTGTLPVQVTPGAAAAISIGLGTPVAQPTPAALAKK